MTLDKALELRPGVSYVNCPPDRGEPGYTGRVEHVTDPEPGKRYTWVTVRRPQMLGGHASVWPSNRIGLVHL